MLRIDEHTPSPEVRTHDVWQQIAPLAISSHDLFCFAVHVCAQNAMIAQDDDLEVITKALGRWLYNYHYQLFETTDEIEKDKEMLLHGIQQIIRLSDNHDVLLGKDLPGKDDGGNSPLAK